MVKRKKRKLEPELSDGNKDKEFERNTACEMQEGVNKFIKKMLATNALNYEY